MQPMAYALLLFGALAGGFVSGLAGFGTALMALGIWLYVLPPSIAVPLVLIWAVLLLALCLQVASGLVDGRVVFFALLAFPPTILGAWLGARLYHGMSDHHFRDVVLALLFLSGMGLVWSILGAR